MVFTEEELRAIILTGSLALLLLSAFIIVLVILFNENIRRRERDGFRQVLRAVEAERQLIGQNLHDDIGPILSGLKLSLEAYVSISGDRLEVSELVKEHKAVMSEIITAVRRSAHNLAPFSLEKYGLVGTIQERCNTINRDHSWHGEVIKKDFPGDLVSKENTLNLFRILTELMNNSIKHSKGNTIRISFVRPNQEDILVEYSDNGVGMAESGGEGSGLGLSGIKTRIKLLNGKYNLKTGSGFQLSMTFNLSRLQKDANH